MKKFILLFAIVLLNMNFLANAQESNDKGIVSLHAGFEGGGYVTFSEATYSGLIARDTGGAVTSLFQFQAQYGFHKRFSAGIGFRRGKYLNDPDDDVDQDNSITSFLIEAKFYPLCREKFNLFLGLGFGSSNLYYIERYTAFSTNYKYEYFFRGGSFRTQFGLNWYFAKFAGLHFGLTLFESNNFKMTQYKENDQVKDSWDTFELDARGAAVNIGVSFKINTAK